MDAVALVISVFSLAVSGVGTVLTNRRTNEAIAESRKATAAALWSAAQEAVQRLIGFDPAAEPIGDRLANLRIAMAGLDTWLEAERSLGGVVIGRQVIENAAPTDTVEQRLATLDPLMVWAHVLSSNLRRFRSSAFDAETAVKLRVNAEAHVKAIYEERGWEQPATTMPGIQTLD
jgi:hypothetical protein